MGGSQSSRKLTISNDDPANVIRVSDSVVQRFRGGDKTEAVSGVSAATERGAGAPTAAATTAHSLPSAAVPQRGSVYPPAGVGLTSLQIRQEKEAELRANDAHWQSRINQLEDSHRKINELMEKEYSAAMMEMRETLFDNKRMGGGDVVPGVVPCSENKRAVLQCYKTHGGSPMLCAKEVQAFTCCVDKQRSALVAQKG